MDNKAIGLRIEQRRKDLGLTLEFVAREIGVAKSTVQRYEKGTIEKIKLPVIEAIARVLDVNPAWICYKSDTMIRDINSDFLAKNTHRTAFSIAESLRETFEEFDKNKSENPNYATEDEFANEMLRNILLITEMKVTQSEEDKANAQITLSDWLTGVSNNNCLKVPESILFCDDPNSSVEEKLLELFEYFPDRHIRLRYYLRLLNDEGFEKTLAYVKDLAENPRYRRVLENPEA